MSYGLKESGRVPNSTHQFRPWRIHEIVPDFTLEDVWALPAQGNEDDFPSLLALIASIDPTRADSRPSRLLWQLRDRLGAWLDLGRIRAPTDGSSDAPAEGLSIPDTDEASLAGRLPEDLRRGAEDLDFGSLPFVPLYRTDDEAAAEISNRTVHGVLHLAWADRGDGRYQGQMAIYVKPRGLFGRAYMASIKPFRYLIVYPAMMRQFERAWSERAR
ncbi:MAG TPA: DUF2867 domain-containing protein [Solirubrobacterales bacterium]|nr:DUF2867 domain-containing protein [Solirubrobacterales bacterium]